jgi:hypothetical protein
MINEPIEPSCAQRSKALAQAARDRIFRCPEPQAKGGRESSQRSSCEPCPEEVWGKEMRLAGKQRSDGRSI